LVVAEGVGVESEDEGKEGGRVEPDEA